MVEKRLLAVFIVTCVLITCA